MASSEILDNSYGLQAGASSFQSYSAEGDILAKQGEYRKAIEAYTRALSVRPNDKGCLVARSKCQLQLGDSAAALQDAETSLQEDAEYFKGIFQKAEALYAQGEFEMALVFYHRGARLRPELQEYRLGIQKAREAIDNSIKNLNKPKTKGKKFLLGELYQDRIFLESLLHDKALANTGSLMKLVEEGIKYLDTRTDFWKQQTATVSTPNVTRRRCSKDGAGAAELRAKKQMEITQRIAAQEKRRLENTTKVLQSSLTSALAESNHREVVTVGTELLNCLRAQKAGGKDFLAHLHTVLGNAWLHLGRVDISRKRYRNALSLAEKHSLDNHLLAIYEGLARVHVCCDDYKRTLHYLDLKESVFDQPSDLDTVCLHHDKAKCNLSLWGVQGKPDFLDKAQREIDRAMSVVITEVEWSVKVLLLAAEIQAAKQDRTEAWKLFTQAKNAAVQGGLLIEDFLHAGSPLRSADDSWA